MKNIPTGDDGHEISCADNYVSSAKQFCRFADGFFRCSPGGSTGFAPDRFLRRFVGFWDFTLSRVPVCGRNPFGEVGDRARYVATPATRRGSAGGLAPGQRRVSSPRAVMSRFWKSGGVLASSPDESLSWWFSRVRSFSKMPPLPAGQLFGAIPKPPPVGRRTADPHPFPLASDGRGGNMAPRWRSLPVYGFTARSLSGNSNLEENRSERSQFVVVAPRFAVRLAPSRDVYLESEPEPLEPPEACKFGSERSEVFSEALVKINDAFKWVRGADVHTL